jgi:hypothetical protein
MGQWLDEGELWWTGYADTVRAVLTAIREPSKAVEKAGMDAAGGDGAVLAGYEAMIDAMLDEG